MSNTYTYLLGCETRGKAMLLDPVINSIDRDLHVLQSLGPTLVYTLDTHVHADHVTAARQLTARVGSRIAGRLLSARRKCATPAWMLHTLVEFTAIMAELDMPHPKFIDNAVPGNRC